MNFELAVQAAILARLSGYAPLSDVAITDHVIQPADTGAQSFPYVVIGEDSFSEWDTDNSLGADGEIVLHTWSRERGRKQVKTIQGYLYSALHHFDLSVTGYALVTLDFVSSESFLDPDGLTRHGVSRFRVLVDS